MANMSYCMFENTADDLRDCVLELEDRLDGPNNGEMLHTERQAAAYMAKLCEQYLEAYSDFAENFPMRDNF